MLYQLSYAPDAPAQAEAQDDSHDPARDLSTAIVGGGMLGLVTALRLAERGERVTIFEAAEDLGGLASAWTLGDTVWDRHYHVTLASDSRVRALLRDLGLEGDVRWTEVGTGFYSEGRWYPMNGALDFLRFPPLGLIDKLRLGLTILRAGRIDDPAPLEDIGVEAWLRAQSGDRTFERVWRPLLIAKLGDRYRDASAAFIWAIIVRLHAARRAGIGSEKFGYLPGGYARILGALEAALRARGVEIVTSCPVVRVRAGVEIELAHGRSRRFSRAIVTVPAPAAARVIADLDAGERARLTSKVYGGIVCASLLLDEPLGPFYVSNLIDPWVPFSAVIDMGNVVDRAQWGGRSIAYLPKYCAPDDPIFECDGATIEANFLDALERMYPRFRRASVRAFRLSRERYVFPIATLGYSRSLPPIVTSVPGVAVLNATQIVNGTLNVNETLGLVERGLAILGGEARA